MKTEIEYADELVEEYIVKSDSGCYDKDLIISIQCALIDVQNTIDAFKQHKKIYGVGDKSIEYYEEVKQILEKR